MLEPQIGYWVKRPYRYGKQPKWHLVARLVNDYAIIRCGKRMAPLTLGLRLEVSEEKPMPRFDGPQLCKMCDSI